MNLFSVIFASVFALFLEIRKAQSSTPVFFTATKVSSITTIQLQSDRVILPKTSFQTYTNLSLNQTMIYSLAENGVYIQLPVSSEFFGVTFNNQNCVFPIVCVDSSNPSIVSLSKGVRVSCKLTSFDSKVKRKRRFYLQQQIHADINV